MVIVNGEGDGEVACLYGEVGVVRRDALDFSGEAEVAHREGVGTHPSAVGTRAKVKRVGIDHDIDWDGCEVGNEGDVTCQYIGEFVGFRDDVAVKVGPVDEIIQIAQRASIEDDGVALIEVNMIRISN